MEANSNAPAPRRFALGDEDTADLFEQFAKLDATESAILGFANRFGPLGLFKVFPVAGSEVRTGETLPKWAQEIRAMRSAVDLAAALTAGEAGQIKQWIAFLGEDSSPTGVRFVRDFVDQAATVLNITQAHSPAAAHLRANGWARAARIVLLEMANERLREDTRARLVFEPRHESLGLRIGCDTLRGALWLQFSSALAGGRIRRCEACRAVLVVAEGVFRSDRRTCGDNCRQRLTRERRAKLARKATTRQKVTGTKKGRARRGTTRER